MVQKKMFRATLFLSVCLLAIALVTAPAHAQKKAGKPELIQNTDPQLRFQWFAEYKEMAKNTPFNKEKWYHIGPTNISGRCTDIAAVSPRGKSYTVYVATASGGVWKTENEGTTWEPIFENEATASIGDIALAPSDPNILWVGSGEANIFRSSQNGAGIYKSTDAGKTWTHMGLADTLTIGRIVVHPTDPDIVYAAAGGHEWTENAERGLYKTMDGGKTWNKILSIDERTGAFDLVMDPTDPEMLYTTAWQRIRLKWNDPRVLPGYDKSGIYKTTDGGATWKEINAGLPAARYRGRIGIDVCLTQPNVLYALVDNYEMARELTPEERADAYTGTLTAIIKGATVYRSDDKGESWTQVSGLDERTLQYMMRHSGTYGWVFGQIKVDPNDPDTVYIMGVPLSVSEDGGKTFRYIRGMHADHHGLWIDPDNSNYIINANDGGIVISYDKGKTWRQFLDNLPLCQFFNVSYDMAAPFRVYGSMQDHGSFRGVVTKTGTRFEAVEWEYAPGGEGSTHAIDPRNPDIVYSAGFYGRISRSDLSKSGAERSKNIFPSQEKGLDPLRGQWIAPIVLSPNHPDTVYLGTQYLYRSRFNGDVWERISPDMSYGIKEELGDIPYQTIFSIAEAPGNANLIYVGTDDGKVHRTMDGGKTWKEIMKGLPYRKWVSEIVASAFSGNTVYMTQNGKREDDFAAYIWKSTDYGETWKDISNNLKLGPVNVIKEDPFNKDILYVGTDVGVYVSKDGGETWNVLGGNLPTVYVQDLVIHPRDNVIIIATHGRGMWAMDATGVNGGPRRMRRS
ncbi:MAG: hypothetical protein KJ908_01145 [Acidobacteria bacterium]|nr:hypothetical protein [Acidobacteriota bacterium]